VSRVIKEGNEAAVCCASQNQTTQIMIVTLHTETAQAH